MKSKLAVACAALLAITALPAGAVQLGEIQIKSALNQPLVAAIPIHPKNLAELDGLTVGLASSADFARAGLAETATDRTLRFHVVTDNNGQKLILVTSSEPVTDPYLDFLIQVNTREGKAVREFVVLLNPTIGAPAPEVQAAPVAGTAPATLPAPPPPVVPPAPEPAAAEAAPPVPAKPAASTPPSAPVPEAAHAAQVNAPARPAHPQPQPEPHAPKPAPVALAPAPAPAAATPEAAEASRITVKRGDTLSGIASDIVPGSGANLDQVMLALQAANPDAFFKHNINNLKAGAILRVPARDELAAQSVAAAAAAVLRQRESWRGVKARPATLVEGTAAEALARSAPAAVPPPVTSDHLSLAPATGEKGGAGSGAGVAGGTGPGAAAGLAQSGTSQRDSLLSLEQSNSELAERVARLQDISGKTGKLLSLKDSTIAELQRKLAALPAGAAAGGGSGAAVAATSTATTVKSAVRAATKPAHNPPWYLRPLTWVIGALVVLALIVLGLLGRRERAPLQEAVRGPLPDPEDLASADAAVDPDADTASGSGDPGNADALPLAAAAPMTEDETGVGEATGGGAEPLVEVAPAPESAAASEWADDPGTITPAPRTAAAAATDTADPASITAAPARASATGAPALDPPVSVEPMPVEPVAAPAVPLARSPDALAPDYGDDPVDIKLDLARAYLDMGDRPGARAMLDEVLAQGSQVQKDEAQRLLAAATE